MKITYETATGYITSFSLKGNVEERTGEAALAVTFEPDPLLYIVQGGEVVERETPLPDPVEQERIVNEEEAAERRRVREAIKNDPIMQTLLNKSLTEVYNAVEGQVTDLSSAKELLKRLAVVCAFLLQAKREL